MMKYYLDEMLRGEKDSDARLYPTDIRGAIALGDSSTNKIHATAELTACEEISYDDFVKWHRTGPFADVEFAPYHEGKVCYAYRLEDISPLPLPVRIDNPSGNRMWVEIPEKVAKNLFSQTTLF